MRVLQFCARSLLAAWSLAQDDGDDDKDNYQVVELDPANFDATLRDSNFAFFVKFCIPEDQVSVCGRRSARAG
jgi:hypothetical protein